MNIKQNFPVSQDKDTGTFGDVLGQMMRAAPSGQSETTGFASRAGDNIVGFPSGQDARRSSVVSTNAMLSLEAAGFGPYIRPCAPPGVNVEFKSGIRLSDGKVPSRFENRRWFGFRGWQAFAPSGGDIAVWAEYPDVNCCLATGDILVLDVDIKIAANEQSAEAQRARALVGAIRGEIARSLATEPDKLPIRERDGSTSCAVFLRWTGAPASKRKWSLTDKATGRTFYVEVLATGQQILVAGRHPSGGAVRSNLAEIGYPDLPRIGFQQLDALAKSLSEVGERHGYDWQEGSKPSETHQRGETGPFTADQAVERAVWLRRSEWARDILPYDATVPSVGEWSVSSEQLDRDLDERLAIFDNGRGAFDFGTERPHTPISLICEFGGIDAQGEIVFGGCPEYGPAGPLPFAVVGEGDPSVSRPTSSQALTWLCRRLGRSDFPVFAPAADWKSSLPSVAQAVGLAWSALQKAEEAFWFEASDSQDAAPFASLRGWSADDIRQNVAMLPAVQARYPRHYAELVSRWGLAGALPEKFDQLVEMEAERVAREMPTVGLSPAQPPLAGAAPDTIKWINPEDWRDRPVPAREWEVAGLIPRGEVTSLYGDGGIGKTLLMHQYATCAAAGVPWLGQETRPARVLCFFCEDGEDELQRRHSNILSALRLDYGSTGGRLRLTSRRFMDNLLAVWDRSTGQMRRQAIWDQLRAAAIDFAADVVVIDTLADVFAGEEQNRVQVTAFVKGCLGRLAQDIGGSVIVLAHPSLSGQSSGQGTSGSTAWSNAVRSRLYLRHQKGSAKGDLRELEGMKSNYGPKGGLLKLRWHRGAFEVLAGSMPATAAGASVPLLDDAAERAVISALLDCQGVQLGVAKNSPYFAPRVLKSRAGEALQTLTETEVSDAIARLEGRKIIRHDTVGRDASRRPIKGYVVLTDNLSTSSAEEASVFE
ncbi:AAA family ATPase [Ancylobacter sp. VNQ12]|uniref:AAA family ATPase n=1 Tax=Ancylobacter sp. VNQ12 TaxID=3400920 RepID=UPI003C000808